MVLSVGEKRRTTYGRVYTILAGPFTGNNGTLYATRDSHDDIIELKSAGVLGLMEKVEE